MNLRLKLTELLSELRKGLIEYLYSQPEVKPQKIYVEIEVTDKELITRTSSYGASLCETMTKMMDGYKERLAEIRSEVQSRRIMNPAHSLEQERMKLEAKLVLLSVLMSELENDVDSYHE